MANFISGYLKRGGISVLFSTALVKFISAILSILVVRMMSKQDYGILSYVLSIYSIVIVIFGFGGNYSLLRFGSITTSMNIRKQYFDYTLGKGIKYSLILLFFIIVYSFFLPSNFIHAHYLLLLLPLAIISFYMLETLRSYFRILNLNKLYSYLNMSNSLLMLFFTLILTYFIKTYGYILALFLSSALTFLCYYRISPKIKYDKIDLEMSSKSYWSYGIHTSVSAIANQIVFSIAPVLLGLLNESNHIIASFKVATIIPFTLLTLPGILMISDFSYLSRSYKDPHILKDYYLNYLKIVMPISTLIFFLLIYWGNNIISLFFGSQYIDCLPSYYCFMIATYFTYVFRNPLGNILLAIGKANWNGYNTYLFCFLYIISTLLFYNSLGYYSAVYSLCATFVLSGFVSLYYFVHYLNTLNY